jgi:hypothetical protein
MSQESVVMGSPSNHLNGQHAVDPGPDPHQHAELARRIAIAVGSYNAGVSYATQEKRMEDEAIDSSWLVVAEKLHAATRTAVSERLLGLFGD